MITPINKILPIPAFQDNYIWMGIDDTSRTAFVVDPGDATPVKKILKEKKLKLTDILITHHHFDHTGGIDALLSDWPNVLIYGSEISPIQSITHRIKENNRITFSSIRFQVLAIPGHTLDHVAYFNDEILFCGDTLFSIGCGKVFEGTPTQMYESLRKIMQLPETIQIFCGHEYTLANLHFAQHIEPNNMAIHKKIQFVKQSREKNKSSLPSTLAEEKKLNPFLRCTEPSIIQAAEKYANKKLRGPIEVFTYLRDWKNHFTV